MDKEKEKVQKILEDAHYFCGKDIKCEVCNEICHEFAVVRQVVKAGYGVVKQAVREFAEYAKQVIVKQFSDTEIEKIKTVGALQLLYNKIEEIYGADE